MYISLALRHDVLHYVCTTCNTNGMNAKTWPIRKSMGSHSGLRREYSKMGPASLIWIASMRKLPNWGGMPSGELLFKRGAISCCWSYTFTGKTTMAKKSSESSRPARLISKTSEDIRNRRMSEKEQ